MITEAQLREKIFSDQEIIYLTKEIVKLQRQEQTDNTKEKLDMLYKLRTDVGIQYIDMYGPINYDSKK